MNLTTEEIQQILDGAKKFGSFADHYDFDTGQYLPNGTESRLSDLREIIELRKRVEELKAQVPKWISVDERLPEHRKLVSEWVLGKNNKFSYPKVVRIVQCGGDKVWQDTSGVCVIVHEWMPLPSCPTTNN